MLNFPTNQPDKSGSKPNLFVDILKDKKVDLDIQSIVENTQLSKSEQNLLYKDLRWIQNPDRILQREDKHSRELQQNTLCACLYELNSLSVGAPLLTPAEREKRLAKIVNYVENENIPGGTSLTYQIFQDYYYSLHKSYLTHQRKKNLRNRKNSVACSFELNLSFQKLFGVISTGTVIGSIWTHPINNYQKPLTLAPPIIRLIDQINEHISESQNSEFVPFSDLLDLLKDVVSNNCGDLYKPISSQIDLSRGFERLKFRASHLKETFEKLDTTNLYKDYFRKFPTDKAVFTSALNKNVDFLNKLIFKIENNSPRLEIFDFLYEESLKNFSAKEDPLAKFNLLIEGDSDRKKTGALILYISYNIINSKDFILREGVLNCFSDQLTGQTNEVDLFLNEIIENLKEIKNKSNSSIWNKVIHLRGETLNSEERAYLDKLVEVILSSESISVERSDALIDLLSFRIEQNLASGSSTVTRALALRDISFELCGDMPVNFRCFLDILTRDQRCAVKISQENIREDLHQLSYMIFNMLQMHLESCEAIKARTRLLLNNNEAVSGLDDQVSEKKKPKRKKKPRKKKAKQNSNASELNPSKDHIDIKNETLSSQSVELKKEAALLENFDSMRVNLKTLKKSKFPTIPQQRFFNASLRNIKHIIRHLEETVPDQRFSADKLFGESDEFRRLAEAALGLWIMAAPENPNYPSSLDQIQTFGHSLIKYAIHIYENEQVQENVKNIVLQHQQAISYFSQANASSNYLHTTREKNTLSQKTAGLTHFFSLVEIEALSNSPNNKLRDQLLQTHLQHSRMILSFVTELLQALADPNYVSEKKEPVNIDTLKLMEVSPLEDIELGSSLEDEMEDLQNIRLSENAPLLSIHSRSEALEAVASALIWLQIRSMSPVEGAELTAVRKTERNLAFKHVKLYLIRLKDKLNDGSFALYDSIVEEMKLMRRAHKELNIGFLYHGNFIKNGQPIVEAENLRYKNNPCLINKVLLELSPQSKFLPNLNEPAYKWMSEAHQWLNYPELQWEWKNPLNPSPWQQQINRIVKTTKKLSRLKRKYELSTEDTDKICLSALQETIVAHVKTEEEEKIFTSLSALLHTIMYGMPLRGQDGVE